MDFINSPLVYPVLFAIVIVVVSVFLAPIDDGSSGVRKSSGLWKSYYADDDDFSYDDDDDFLTNKLREFEEYEEYMDEMRQDKPPRDPMG